MTTATPRTTVEPRTPEMIAALLHDEDPFGDYRVVVTTTIYGDGSTSTAITLTDSRGALLGRFTGSEGMVEELVVSGETPWKRVMPLAYALIPGGIRVVPE